MASDGNTGLIPVVSLVQGSPAVKISSLQAGSGSVLPSGGTPEAAPKAAVQPSADPQVLVDRLNKYLNNSGRPDQFRLDPTSGGKLIQQFNPANGDVIGEFSVTEFPALARSVGVTSLMVDSRA
jgi:hypothetical protein